jgi:ATP-dependent helicase/nuclease subunit A
MDLFAERTNMDPEFGNSKKLSPISLVRASAGTGKTFCLTQEFASLLLAQGTLLSVNDVHAHQIIATTFTNKAADELMQRIQSFLVALGSYDLARLIRGSYIGTVNSICGRLVSEYALEGGLSPSIKVLDELRQRKLFIACSEDPFGAFTDRLSDLAHRLSIEDWRKEVFQIVELSRQNAVDRASLLAVSSQSWNRLEQLLPEPFSAEMAKELDAELMDAVKVVVHTLERCDDDTKITSDALEFLRIISFQDERHGYIPWSSWARISKLKVASKTQSELKELKGAASRYLRHPRLRKDWRQMIENVISCACMCIDRYATFKLDNGLIDFIDQEQLAHSLLGSGLIAKDLGDRCKVLMVDEFQDTSPIQLGVFLKLGQSVQRSLWVGDVKQSIFGFRGADPQLMNDVCSKLIAETGGSEHHLRKSYRSRPELVSFSNSLFGTCMPPLGTEEGLVRISEVARETTVEMEDPIHFWWLNGKTFDEVLTSLSANICELLSNSKQLMVHDSDTKKVRPIVGSDIAVLCRSNDHRLELATRLALQGLHVATERTGLLNTPECVLALAALRYLVDAYDTLSAATIIRFSFADNEWLSQWLQVGFAEFAKSVPALQAIDQNRFRLTHLTPLETLELAIVGSGIIELIRGLGEFRQRALNLDALRGLALGYEDDCLATGRTATAAGLIAYLQEASADAMQPKNPSPHAINVLTYHKAKGLEWPLVVLFDLDSMKTGTAFGACIEQDVVTDIREPLTGRTIRYWPWPYGKQRVDVELGQVPRSKETLIASRKEYAEAVRLMYVGVTRARDYLVFAARPTIDGTDWLKELRDADGNSVLSLPYENGRFEILRNGSDVHFANMQILNPAERPEVTTSLPTTYSAPKFNRATAPIPYRITPSDIGLHGNVPEGALSVYERTSLGPRVVLTGSDDVQRIGDVVHCFFAADDVEQLLTERMQLGCELLSAWKVQSLKAFDLVSMSNRLIRVMQKKYVGAKSSFEYPVSGSRGNQRIRGSIDLLLKTNPGFVILDHKTFHGRIGSCEEKALSYGPQLLAYKSMIEQSCSEPVIACYIHFPLLGELVEISVQ